MKPLYSDFLAASQTTSDEPRYTLSAPFKRMLNFKTNLSLSPFKKRLGFSGVRGCNALKE